MNARLLISGAAIVASTLAGSAFAGDASSRLKDADYLAAARCAAIADVRGTVDQASWAEAMQVQSRGRDPVVRQMADNARRDVTRSARQAEAGSTRAMAEIARIGANCTETLAKVRTNSGHAAS
jgi:hypothetical protein